MMISVGLAGKSKKLMQWVSMVRLRWGLLGMTCIIIFWIKKIKNIQQQGFACGHPPYY
jgi:hypothetical protein